MTVHVCAIKDYANLRDVAVAGCTDKIIGVYFLHNSLHILIVSVFTLRSYVNHVKLNQLTGSLNVIYKCCILF